MTIRVKAMLAVGAAVALTLSACGGSDSGSSTPNAAPTDKVLHLSFLQDPGQPPDPDPAQGLDAALHQQALGRDEQQPELPRAQHPPGRPQAPDHSLA